MHAKDYVAIPSACYVPMKRFNKDRLCNPCGGLMVSVLDSGLRGPDSSPGKVIVLSSWATFPSVSLCIKVHTVYGYQKNKCCR